MRLIDADKLKKELEIWKDVFVGAGDPNAIGIHEYVMVKIDQQPTIYTGVEAPQKKLKRKKERVCSKPAPSFYIWLRIWASVWAVACAQPSFSSSARIVS